MSTLGTRLRQLRHERACTLQEVSDGSGLTPSFLSRLERGIVNISVGNLRKVAAFFGVPITFFFTEEIQPHGLVVRMDERQIDETGGISRASLLPKEADQLVAEIITIAPGVEGTGPLSGLARAIYYVLEGELHCSLSGQEYRLGAGDVLYQRRPLELLWRNNRGRNVVILAASLRPNGI